MTLKKARELLEGITYKEGWKFEVWESNGNACLYAQMPRCKNAANPLDETLESPWIRHYFMLDTLDKVGFLHQVEIAVQSMELHEMNEWLKFNGQTITTPQH